MNVAYSTFKIGINQRFNFIKSIQLDTVYFTLFSITSKLHSMRSKLHLNTSKIYSNTFKTYLKTSKMYLNRSKLYLNTFCLYFLTSVFSLRSFKNLYKTTEGVTSSYPVSIKTTLNIWLKSRKMVLL